MIDINNKNQQNMVGYIVNNMIIAYSYSPAFSSGLTFCNLVVWDFFSRDKIFH